MAGARQLPLLLHMLLLRRGRQGRGGHILHCSTMGETVSEREVSMPGTRVQPGSSQWHL